MIGDNAATFDTPILLRNAGENFVKDLVTIDVRFADTLPLFKKLVHYKHPSLQQADGSPCKSNQSSLYSSLFEEEFDALADVLAVKRIILSPGLHLSGKFIVQSHGGMSRLEGLVGVYQLQAVRSRRTAIILTAIVNHFKKSL